MTGTISRPRLAFALIAIFIAVVFFLGFGERQQTAQERPSEPAALKARFEEFAVSDDVTRDIRDRSRELVRVQFRSIADRENVTRFGRIVQDFGSSVLLSKTKSSDPSRSGMDVARIETTVNLPGKKFDPVQEPPVDTVRAGDAGRLARGYYLIQLGGFATDEWLDSIRDAGVEILQYAPHNAFFVYADGGAIAKVAGHSRVRWVGEHRPEYKLSGHVKDVASNAKSGTTQFEIAVFKRASLDEVVSRVGGRLISKDKLPNNFFNVLVVEVASSQLDEIAKIPDVVRIDPYVRPTPEDERSSQIIAGNYSNPTTLAAPGYNPLAQFGADGTGVTVMMSDDGVSIPGNGGLYITSANTVDGPLRGAAPGATGGHGHINASIIAGNTPFGVLDDLGYNYGLGVAPKANIINIPFLVGTNTTTDAEAVDDALNTLGPNGVRGTISNNSWGAGTNLNAYGTREALYDGLVRDGSFAPTIDPFNIIFSAGNSGPGGGTLTRPKVSKNTIAVANSENVRPGVLPFPVPSPAPAPIGTAADNMEDLRTSSSRGPAADGRIKPDITAPGTVITGSRAGSCSSVSGCFDSVHAYSTGTSHAAPQVAGAAALFTNYWRNSHAGAYPNPSLIKAAIINSGREMNGLTTNTATIPNGMEGWGRINMKLMMNTGVPTLYNNEETVLSNTGTAVGFIGRVADSTKPVRITLVWTDPPGVSDPALVNNLDLQVNVNGNLYRGNVFSGGVSIPGGSADTVNNVENIFLPAGVPAGAFFSVGVSAVTLNGDGALGNADTTDQHFSIVAYNWEPLVTTDADPPVDFDGDDRTDVSIRRSDSAEHWWVSRSSDNGVFATTFGPTVGPSMAVPADYTGDGKADVAAWKPADGTWLVQRSEDFSYYSVPFGSNGDLPVPADYDGDGKIDRAVYRPSTGTWYITRSSNEAVDIITFGVSTDRPVPADYDGDGKADIAIFRASSGQWWLNRSAAGVVVYTFGLGTDRQVHGDYTGDGKADAAVWRPSTGEWFVLRSDDLSYYSVPFGSNGDVPSPGDYDGDDKFDTAVFRPSTATWYVDRSTSGILIQNFGISTDTSLPSVYAR